MSHDFNIKGAGLMEDCKIYTASKPLWVEFWLHQSEPSCVMQCVWVCLQVCERMFVCVSEWAEFWLHFWMSLKPDKPETLGERGEVSQDELLIATINPNNTAL